MLKDDNQSMVLKVPFVKWKKSSKYFRWTWIICFIITMLSILLGIIVSEFYIGIGILFVIPCFISGLILKFKNNSNIEGHILFGQNDFILEQNNLTQHFLYSDISKLDINNFEGQEYYSTDEFFPFYEGLNNYIYFKRNIHHKIEMKINDKWTYQKLNNHLESNRFLFDQKVKWRIKKI